MNELFNLEGFVTPEEVMASVSEFQIDPPAKPLYGVDLPPEEEMM